MAGKNTSVTLGDQLEKFAAEQVRVGAYGSVSEVVRAGVRLLQESEIRIEALRAAIREGEESGPAEPFDFQQFISEMKARSQDAA